MIFVCATVSNGTQTRNALNTNAIQNPRIGHEDVARPPPAAFDAKHRSFLTADGIANSKVGQASPAHAAVGGCATFQV